MTHKLILDRSDIEKIIAKEFGVPFAKDTLYLEDAMVGYGPTEQIEKVVQASVLLSNPEVSWERSET